MLTQITIGFGLILISTLIPALTFTWMEGAYLRHRHWLSREPHHPKRILVLSAALLWILALITAAVWVWAAAFWVLGIFVTLEASVYFALVAFTTLGFGDVLLPQEWRLLAGMCAANGLLNFGLFTAILVETLRQVRQLQIESNASES
jgi:hypothetical protein